ncbi:hypothetical protein WOLCODRAFT_136515, partial [Wolfiporia cocos MD-104 SS10]
MALAEDTIQQAHPGPAMDILHLYLPRAPRCRSLLSYGSGNCSFRDRRASTATDTRKAKTSGTVTAVTWYHGAQRCGLDRTGCNRRRRMCRVYCSPILVICDSIIA